MLRKCLSSCTNTFFKLIVFPFSHFQLAMHWPTEDLMLVLRVQEIPSLNWPLNKMGNFLKATWKVGSQEGVCEPIRGRAL